MPAIHDGAAVMRRARILAEAARMLGVPVIGTAQSPSRLGPNVAELACLFDLVIDKDAFDACAAPGFLEVLPPSRDQLLVAGCEAHVCVLQTVLGLRARGREVRLAADAVGSRRGSDKDAGLRRAAAAGAQILTSEMAIFEWLRTSNHPEFRRILGLIREI